jgi:hypothetical protein
MPMQKKTAKFFWISINAIAFVTAGLSILMREHLRPIKGLDLVFRIRAIFFIVEIVKCFPNSPLLRIVQLSPAWNVSRIRNSNKVVIMATISVYHVVSL